MQACCKKRVRVAIFLTFYYLPASSGCLVAADGEEAILAALSDTDTLLAYMSLHIASYSNGTAERCKFPL